MKKVFRFSVFFILFILLIVFVGGVYVFTDRFQPGTYVNDVDLSLTKKSDLFGNYADSSKGFKLKLVESNGVEYIDAKDFDYSDRLNEGSQVNQNPLYWMVTFLVPKHYNLEHSVSMNDAKFNALVNNLNLFKEPVKEPQDAKIVFDGGKFVIQDEVMGNVVNKEKLIQAILAHFDEGNKELVLADEGIYVEPLVFSDDPVLVKKCEQMNKINSFVITYDFDDRVEELKNDVLISLYSEDSSGNLVPDREKVKKYVIGLAKKYDTFKATRTFQTTGKGIAQISGGIYGWRTDIEKTTDELMSALSKAESVKIKPVYSSEAMSRKVNDIGNTYIEIDLARQHMWFYKDGALFAETDVVTGNPNKGNGTPTGTSKIWSRERERELKGEGYSSHVSYWLPFNWSGCGIHDSTWRSSYGKNIYLTNGSHGCVNTPPSIMPKIYENTFNGLPVVVYDSNTQIIQPPV